MRASITQVRRALAETLGTVHEVSKVLMAPSENDSKDRGMGYPYGAMNFVVRFIVGKPDEETEDQVDDLITDIYGAFREHPTLGIDEVAQVKSCSGHRVYQTEDGARLGVEFIVKVS